MHMLSRYFLLLAAPLLMTSGLRAQAPATASPGHREVDLAVTYIVQHSNLVSNPTFWQQGGSVELSAQVYRGWGAAANITGTNVGSAADSGVGLSMVTATFGPRYTWYRPNGIANKRSLAIFGQGLIGESNGFNSYFPSNTGSMTNYNSFALQVGGGVDIGLSRHFAVRAIQADWLRTQFPNSTTNIQNSFRLGARCRLPLSTTLVRVSIFPGFTENRLFIRPLASELFSDARGFSLHFVRDIDRTRELTSA